MLMEQIKCKCCHEYEFVQIGTEIAEARLCYGCEEEYGIDVQMCEECDERPITRHLADYCEECMDSQMEEWEQENKDIKQQYFNSLL